jgi:hypothetical protein
MASSLDEIMKLTPTKEVRFKGVDETPREPISRDESASRSASPSQPTIPSFNWTNEYMKSILGDGAGKEIGVKASAQPTAPKTFSPEISPKRDNFVDLRDEMADQKKEVSPININTVPQENLDSTAKQTILSFNHKSSPVPSWLEGMKRHEPAPMSREASVGGGFARATDEEKAFSKSIQAPDREIVIQQAGDMATGYNPHAGMAGFEKIPATYGSVPVPEIKITLPNKKRIIPKDVEAAERYLTLMDGEKYTKRDKNVPYKITATDMLAMDLVESDPKSPDGIVANFSSGYNEGRIMFDEGGMADLGHKMASSNKDEWNDPKSEIRKQFEKLEYIRNNSTAGKSRELIDSTTNPIAKFFYEGTSGLAQQAAMYGSALDESAKGALAGAVGGPGGAALGAKAGFTYSMFKLEKGMAYIQYRDAGMDHETAIEMSSVAGAVNAAIEYFELSLLAKGLPSAVKLISKNIYNRIPNKILRSAVSVGGAYAGTAGAEITQEGIQQMVTNLMQNRGFDKMNEEAGFDKYEIMPPKQLAAGMWEEMKAVTPTMAMMSFFGLPANFNNFRSSEFNIGVSKRAVDALDAIEKLESNPNLQAEDVQEYQKNLDVLMNYSSFVSQALRNDYLSRENRDKIQEVLILSNATIQKYTEKPSAPTQEAADVSVQSEQQDVNAGQRVAKTFTDAADAHDFYEEQQKAGGDPALSSNDKDGEITVIYTDRPKQPVESAAGPASDAPAARKRQGQVVSTHKTGENVLMPAPTLEEAKAKAGNPDYDIIKVNEKTGDISFVKVDDFDGKTEPEIVSVITVKKDGTVVDETPAGRIIVDKAKYVPDDYAGFDVQAAKDRETAWRKAGVNYDSTQIDNKDYFENHLRNVGLLPTEKSETGRIAAGEEATLFHGSPRKFNGNDIRISKAQAGEGIFLTDSMEEAKEFGENIYYVTIKPNKIATDEEWLNAYYQLQDRHIAKLDELERSLEAGEISHDEYEDRIDTLNREWTIDERGDMEQNAKVSRLLKEQGYDVYVGDLQSGNPGNEYVVLNRDIILSTKNKNEVDNTVDVPVEDEAVINPQSEEGRSGEESHGTAPKTGSTDSSRPETASKEEGNAGPKKNVGVHFGDLGKTEYLMTMNGSRGTGHFGTGTYFVSPESDAIPRMTKNSYGERPRHEVSFEGYNLYRPKDVSQGRKLHEFLKQVNKWAYDNELYRDSIADMYNNNLSLFDNAFTSEAELESYLLELRDYVLENKEKDEQAYFAKTERYDSPSTKFMKYLGYEGVDVRGLKGLDDEEFGSVIYDLRKEAPAAKAEEKPVAKEKEKVDNEGKKVTRELRNKVYEILGPENTNSKENRDRIDAALDDIVSNKLGIDDSYNALMNAVKGITLTEGIADSISSEAKALAKLVRDTKIKLTGTLRNNIADFEAYRKSILRIVRLSNDGRDIDTFYQELLELYPEYFDADIVHPADQLEEIVDVIKGLEKRETFKLSDVLTDIELVEMYVAPILNEVIAFMKEGTFNDTGRKEVDGTSQPSKRNEGETSEPVSEREKEKRRPESKVENPKQVVADKVYEKIQTGTKFTSQELFDIADEAFGGTQGQGVYDVRTAFDAMELAVNRYLIDRAGEYKADTPEQAIKNIEKLEGLLSLLPTQGSKRTETMEKYQQFSTPPTIAYLADYVANVQKGETVLEPSAGVGGLVALPHGWGAMVHVNELEKGRYDTVQLLPFAGFSNQNAEQINNVLPDFLKPTLVIMNPPFSTAAERTGNNRNTENAKRHIEQALLKLEPNGRLVAIVGRGMAEDAATFKDWWKQIKGKYNVKANVRIDGSNYKKYGTTFDIQLLVIDKDGPTVNETLTGEYANLSDAVNALEGIRNERHSTVKPEAAVDDGEGSPGRSGRVGAVSASGSGTGGGNVSGSERSGGKGSVPERPDGASSKTGQKESVSGNDRADGRTGDGNPDKPSPGPKDETVRPDGRNTVKPAGKLSDGLEVVDKKVKLDTDIIENEDDVYTVYRSKKLNIKGAQKHPTDLVESAAMSAVDAPEITYVPKLDKKLAEEGILSDAQLEIISYAGQAHEKMLPDGKRQGFFIGDGTGVGKGREVAGIILDNFNQGRKRAVWISNNAPLLEDAIRDWTALGGNKKEILLQGKTKAESDITQKEGILFTTYPMLRGGSKKDKSKTRLKQIVDYFGKDYDGVIVFDEAHNMGNARDSGEGLDRKKASEMGRAGVELQNLLPNARIVYASATGATEVHNLAYLTRLGLWGKGTAFSNVDDFIGKIDAGGLAAMELVARDMKSLGVYAARNLSFKGVEYDTLIHELTPIQEAIYDEMSKTWQIVLQNVDQVLEDTNGNKNSRAKAYAKSQFFSSMQRFYNQIITSMSMPSVVENIRLELENGNSAVIQLTNTNEALAERRISAAEDEGISLDDIDLTPTDTLIEYLNKGFPINEYEEYMDDDGNLRSRPAVDADGNPIISREAVRKRDELIEFVKQLKVPEGPLEILFNEFGTENIAEITGRSRRLVPDENGKKVLEARSENAKLADAQAFQDGKKRILIFSDAGGTGRSYHADKEAKNQQRRIHYLLQPGWNAFKATQGFGRTHRSNQAVAPIFRLITTNIAGQKRFTSTIARRLDQLGALTKGQRQAGSGVFSQKDNLENSIARDALQAWYKRLAFGGFDLDAKSVIMKLGLYDKLYDQYGNYRENLDIVRDTGKFLNRILAIEVKEQNEIFETFESVLDDVFSKAVEAGSVDMGTENFITDKLEVKDEKVLRKDKATGAETKYLQITASKRPNILDFENVPTYNPKFVGLVRLNDSGEVRAVYRSANKTTRSGEVTESYNLLAPALELHKSNYIKKTLDEKTTPIPKSEWRKEWNRQIENTPEYVDSTLHVITGVLLPVWKSLPTDKVKVMRIMDTQGKNQYLGRIIPPTQIDSVLLQFNTHRTKEVYTSEQIYNKILNDNQIVSLRDFKQRLERRKVSGENRIEIKGNNLWYFASMPGIITERINFEYRYFVPTDKAKALPILDAIMTENPVVEIKSNNRVDDNEYQSMTANSVVGQFYKPTGPASAQNAITPEVAKGPIKPISQIIVEISKAFGTPITSKRYSGRKSLGRYNTSYGFIETKYANTIGVVSHELGHHFDKAYSILKNYRQELKFLANKMEPEVKKAYKPQDLPGEAMAEFMRLYLINPQGAYEFAELENNRNFYDIFESLISESDMKKLKAVRGDILNFLAASVEEQAKTTIHPYGEKAKTSLEEKRMAIYSEWVNGYESFEVMNRKIKELTGREIAPSDNAYYLALQSQRGDVLAHRLVHGRLVDLQGNPIGESFSSLYENINKKERADFDLYLKFVHALDWMDQGKMVFSPDYSRSDIEAAISRLEARYPHFSATANSIYEWWDKFVRAWLVDTGFMEEEVYETMHEMYPHYVPNFRMEDGVVNTVGGKKAKAGFSNQTNPVRRASEKGSARDTYSATQSMIMEIDRYVKSVLRRDVMLALHRNYNNTDYAEVMGDFMRKVPPEKQRHVYNAMDMKANLKGDLFMNEISRLSPEERERFEKLSVNEQIKYFQSTGIDMTIDNIIDDYIVFYTPKKISTDASIVTVVDKGKTFFYEVFDKYMAQALTNLGPQELNGVIKILAEIKRAMTVLTTGGNPIFGLTSNIFRDVPQAYIMGKYTNPIEFAWALIDATKSVITKDEKYQKYKDMGGGFESPIGADARYIKKTLRQMPGGNTGVLNKVGTIVDFIEEINNLIETVPRLTEFNKYMQKGGDTYDNRLESMYRAADVTLNFQRKGSGSVASTLVQVIPFFNAGIQGIDKFYRGTWADKESRRKTIIKSLALISVFSIMQALSYANDDDYDELPEFYKNNYWLIKYAPGKFIRIPRPRELNVLFGVIFERAIREMLHSEEDNGKALLMAFKDNFLVPTSWVLAPVYDAKANRTWSGGSIVSQRDEVLMTDGYYNEVYDDTTSRIAVLLAKMLPDVESLGVINTPKGIEYLIKQYTGGLGQIILPATTPSSEGPVAGIQRKMTVDVAYSSKYVDEFYRTKAKLDAAERVYKDRGKMTDDYNEEWRLAFQRFNNGFKSTANFDDPPLPRSAEKILKGQKGYVGLSKKWAEIREINNDDSLMAEEKHDKIREVRLEINDVTKQLIKAYEEDAKK